MGQPISSLTFLNVNLLHIIHIYLNVYKQMIDVKLLLLHSNSGNHLTVCKQVWRSKWNDLYNKKYLKPFCCEEK